MSAELDVVFGELPEPGRSIFIEVLKGYEGIELLTCLSQVNATLKDHEQFQKAIDALIKIKMGP